MQMQLIDPTKILLPTDDDSVKAFLTYDDKSVAYQISRLKQNIRFRAGDPEKFKERMDQLKLEQKKCLVNYDVHGQPWTYAGLWRDLSMRFGWSIDGLSARVNEDDMPIIPWKTIPHDMRYYQSEAVEALCNVGHGAIELPTGSGKSLIIMNLLKRYPVKTLIITPFSNITNQLRIDLERTFGSKLVGQLGDTRKKTDRLFTVANAQSATRILENTKEWDDLHDVQMVIFDESHMVPAASFQNICLEGVAKNAKLRFFLSATQTRTDGSELLLKGITGPVVYKKTYKELSEEGFLKKVKSRVFSVAPCKPSVNDPKKETRANLYENPNVARLAAILADKAYNLAKRQIVILVDEYSQFLLLKNHMTIPYEFAHGTVTKEQKKALPEQYWKCDVEKIVDDFNKGNLPCIIGTTAIATGVDIRPTGCLIYLQGGASEIKVKQGVGRGTRPVGPEDLWVCDFRVAGSKILERHADTRKKIYESLTDQPVDEVGRVN